MKHQNNLSELRAENQVRIKNSDATLFARSIAREGLFFPPAILILSAMLLLPVVSLAQNVRVRRNSPVRVEPDIRREPNRYAPELYAERQNLIITLVNLPGAKTPRSVWDVTYKVYFLSESAHDRAVKNLAAGGSNPKADDFREKLLLTEGRFRKTSLNTLQKRTHISAAIPFKSRMPDKDRTKFAYIMTAYDISVTDAVLGKTIRRSGILMARPFDNEGERVVPRKTIYANFLVTSEGDFYYSQLPQSTAIAVWR